ncbi:MAG: hypothetical protein L0Z70_12655 [Chloroflexi bacterium]|nr:hypothetical protein [Chloroflexota bacterium]
MYLRKNWLLSVLILALAACSLPAQPGGVRATPEAIITATRAQSEAEAGAATPSAEKIAAPQAATPSATPQAQPSLVEMPQAAAVGEGQARFGKQAGAPVSVANFIRPEAGCEWLGLGGQVFDINGAPVEMLVVEVGGLLEGQQTLKLTLTGNEAGLGEGGFLVELADHATADSDLWVQVLDLAGVAQSDKIPFATYAECDKNFTLVNFTQIPANLAPRMIFPIIYKR